MVETLASEIAALSDYFVETSVRDGKRAAAAVRDADEARQRMEVLPAVLAICGRLAIDSPLDGQAVGTRGS